MVHGHWYNYLSVTKELSICNNFDFFCNHPVSHQQNFDIKIGSWKITIIILNAYLQEK